MLAAIEKRRKEEETAKKAKQGWGISSWWYGSGKLSEDSVSFTLKKKKRRSKTMYIGK